MREDRTLRSVRFLQAASKAKLAGMNCPNALFEAYREELGEQYPAALALVERLPEELNEPNLCDVFAAAIAIISTLTDQEDGCEETIVRMRKEYGTNGCGTDREETPLCMARMKDSVLLIEWARSQWERKLERKYA